MKIFVIFLLANLLISVALQAETGSIISVRDGASSIQMFNIITTECDNKVKAAKLLNGMDKYPFTYKCVIKNGDTNLEIRSNDKLVVAISSKKGFNLTVPFEKNLLSISSN